MAIDKRRHDSIAEESYFSRSILVWCCICFLFFMAFFVGLWGLLFPFSFWEFMLFGQARPYAQVQSLIQIRGFCALMLGVSFVVAFARGSCCARYLVYLGTAFVCVNFFLDVRAVAGNFESWASLSSASYLLMRPFMMFGLLVMSYSFHDTAHLERPPFWSR